MSIIFGADSEEHWKRDILYMSHEKLIGTTTLPPPSSSSNVTNIAQNALTENSATSPATPSAWQLITENNTKIHDIHYCQSPIEDEQGTVANKYPSEEPIGEIPTHLRPPNFSSNDTGVAQNALTGNSAASPATTSLWQLFKAKLQQFSSVYASGLAVIAPFAFVGSPIGAVAAIAIAWTVLYALSCAVLVAIDYCNQPNTVAQPEAV